MLCGSSSSGGKSKGDIISGVGVEKREGCLKRAKRGQKRVPYFSFLSFASWERIA